MLTSFFFVHLFVDPFDVNVFGVLCQRLRAWSFVVSLMEFWLTFFVPLLTVFEGKSSFSDGSIIII